MSLANPDDGTTDARRGLENPVALLSRFALTAQVFRVTDGRFFARVDIGGRHEVLGLRSRGFHDWLIAAYLLDQPVPPSEWAICRVIGMLEARARFNSDAPEVFIRVGRGESSSEPVYFLDLGDHCGRAIEVHPQGWFVVDQPEVHFRRPAGQLALPLPFRDGSVELLRPYVNLTEADFRLMITWITAVLRPVGPYPILVLNGLQASGKTTLVRILRFLTDPQVCPAVALPSSACDLLATAVNGWLLAYDNVSDISPWLSDMFCQLVFGGGFAGRALFTNDERRLIYAQRPVLLSGIDDFACRGDLRDRCVFLHPPSISDQRRRGEAEFWRAFHADYPLILGGVLDLIAGGLRELPSVRLSALPRMADYAIWGEAVARGAGMVPGSFLSIYNANRRNATETILEQTVLGRVMLQFAGVKPTWSGTPATLYVAVSKAVGKATAASARWPGSPREMSIELRRLAPQLALQGLVVEFGRNGAERCISLRSAEMLSEETQSIDCTDYSSAHT
jgi:hypothetical protein